MGRPKKVKELSASEKFYIAEKAKTETAEKIAEDLGLTLEQVRTQYPAPVAQSTPPAELSTAEIFYITTNAGKVPTEEIAATLGRSVEEVQIHVPARQNSRMLTLMGRQTKAGNQSRGIAVMTPDASSLADSTRSNRVRVAGRYVDCIHRPLG